MIKKILLLLLCSVAFSSSCYADGWIGCEDGPSHEVNTTLGGYTYIYAETAPETGYISQIELYCGDATPDTFQFAVFSRSVNDFTDKASKQDFTLSGGLVTYVEGTDYATDAFPINTGEYFGFYHEVNAHITRDDAAGVEGYLFYLGDGIGDTGAETYDTSREASGRETQIRVYIRVPTVGRRMFMVGSLP